MVVDPGGVDFDPDPTSKKKNQDPICEIHLDPTGYESATLLLGEVDKYFVNYSYYQHTLYLSAIVPKNVFFIKETY